MFDPRRATLPKGSPSARDRLSRRRAWLAPSLHGSTRLSVLAVLCLDFSFFLFHQSIAVLKALSRFMHSLSRTRSPREAHAPWQLPGRELYQCPRLGGETGGCGTGRGVWRSRGAAPQRAPAPRPPAASPPMTSASPEGASSGPPAPAAPRAVNTCTVCTSHAGPRPPPAAGARLAARAHPPPRLSAHWNRGSVAHPAGPGPQPQLWQSARQGRGGGQGGIVKQGAEGGRAPGALSSGRCDAGCAPSEHCDGVRVCCALCHP